MQGNSVSTLSYLLPGFFLNLNFGLLMPETHTRYALWNRLIACG